MGTISEKALYLNETKRRIKDRINLIGGDLDDTNTFREYAEELDSIYDDMPKVEGEGSNFTINQTRKGGLEVTPKGNCEQEVIAAVAGTIVEGSNLTVNDFDTTKEMTITPEGNCEQDSYSGKNKFDTDNWYNLMHSFDSAIEKVTVNGIEYIKLRSAVGEVRNYEYMKGQFAENTQYILSFKGYRDGITSTAFRFVYTDSTTTYTFVTDTTETTYTVVSLPNKTIDYINLYYANTDFCYIRDIQLEVGSTATTYEPYVGRYSKP